MQDLRDSIGQLITNAVPVKMGSVIVGYCVGKYDIKELIAEYNIHFVEPKDKQFDLDPYPYSELRISEKNVVNHY